jgi:hypothetical protein
MDQDPDNLNAPDLEHGKQCWGPDPGSGAFLAPGSGIQILDGKISGSGSWMEKNQDPDPGWKNIRIRNEQVFGVNND